MLKTSLKLLNPLTVPRNLKVLLRSADPTGIVFLLGFVASVWGVGLLNPYTNTFTISSFTFLAGLAPENIWGAWALLWGLIQMTIVTNGDIKVRGWMGLADTFWWTFIAAGMALSHSASVATYVFIAFAIAGIWAYVVSRRLHA
jgi:hypothetical protein